MTKKIPLAEVIVGDAEPLAQSVAVVLTPLIAPHLKRPLEVARVSLEAGRDGNSARCILIRLRLTDPRVQRIPVRSGPTTHVPKKSRKA